MAVIDISKTWESSAAYYTAEIWNDVQTDLVDPNVRFDIREHLDSMIDQYFGTSADPSAQEWITLARMSITASGVLEESSTWETLCRKQRDYGPNNIARFGSSGILLRLHDKVARLENLLDHDKDAQYESVQDTYLDIVGYSVIGLMLLDGSFFYPMTDG